MNKEALHKKVLNDIELMMVGNQFDIRHLFGLTVWGSFPKSDQDEIAKLFVELVQNELNEQIAISEANQNLDLQKYIKKGTKSVKKPIDVFPNEPVTINRGSRGNA
jgi:hypothetical protein